MSDWNYLRGRRRRHELAVLTARAGREGRRVRCRNGLLRDHRQRTSHALGAERVPHRPAGTAPGSTRPTSGPADRRYGTRFRPGQSVAEPGRVWRILKWGSFPARGGCCCVAVALLCSAFRSLIRSTLASSPRLLGQVIPVVCVPDRRVMIASAGRSWLSLPQHATDTGDHAAPTDAAILSGGHARRVLKRSPRNAGVACSGTLSLARRPRPGTHGLAHSNPVSGATIRLASTTAPDRCGRVGFTTEPRGHLSGRPRLRRTPVRDETAFDGCHATACGPDPHPADPRIGEDQRLRYLSRIPAPHPCSSGTACADHEGCAAAQPLLLISR